MILPSKDLRLEHDVFEQRLMVYICMAILVCYSHEDECGIVLVGHEKRAPPCLVFSIQLGRGDTKERVHSPGTSSARISEKPDSSLQSISFYHQSCLRSNLSPRSIIMTSSRESPNC